MWIEIFIPNYHNDKVDHDHVTKRISGAVLISFQLLEISIS